jgi:hypothetical protein
MAVRDSFTPDNQRELSARDLDLGSGGPTLTPNGLLLAGGKDDKLYVLDRDHSGKKPPRRGFLNSKMVTGSRLGILHGGVKPRSR